MTPSRRDRLKPVEYLAFAGAIGVFSALVVLLVIREDPAGLVIRALVVGGIAFIVSLVIIATLTLATKPASKEPRDDDPGERRGH